MPRDKTVSIWIQPETKARLAAIQARRQRIRRAIGLKAYVSMDRVISGLISDASVEVRLSKRERHLKLKPS